MVSLVSNVHRLGDNFQPPAQIQKYIDSIGAEPRNFRRYVIKREGKDHYHVDTCVIKIDGKMVDGKFEFEFHCPMKEHEPSKETLALIEEEVKHAVENKTWPKNINARNSNVQGLNTDGLRAMLGDDANLFEFRDENGELIYVQQRVIKDGQKRDYPWSFFSDSKWYSMEPDGDLPIFGLEKLKGAAVVFLHEGAKCAAHMTPDFLKGHPWEEQLTGIGVVHLGWPGGAPNPHRVDWGPINKLPAHIEVYIVADNDISGKNAVPLISRRLHRKSKAIQFSNTFPDHFDLAGYTDVDGKVKKWPAGNKTKFEECVINSTWATRVIEIDGKKKRYGLREEFEKECNWIVKPQVFIHRSCPDQMLKDVEFNGKFARFSDVKDLAALLVKSNDAYCEALAYEPGQPTGPIPLEGEGIVFNCYRPPNIKAVKGDIGPWLAFLEKLIPKPEERHLLKRWIATLISRHDIKMHFGIILISEQQGVGKGVLVRGAISPLLGWHNVSMPSEDQLMKSPYNSYVHNKRLVHADELYSGNDSKVYNKLKGVISEERTELNLKYITAYNIHNWVHVIACSNSLRAMKLEKGDRRWFVPTVSEDKMNPEYWKATKGWLDNHLPQILWWSNEFVKDEANVIFPGEQPPMSDRKRDVTRANMGEGSLMIDDFGEALQNAKGEKVVRMDKLRLWLIDRHRALNPNFDIAKLPGAELTASILRSRGLCLPTKDMRDKINGKPIKFKVAANFVIDNNATWGYIKQHEALPADIADEDDPELM